MKTEKPKTVDETLDEKTIQQLTWKPDITRNIAIRIAAHFIKDRIAYTDELDMSFVPTLDANCIGMSYRRLKQSGIIIETGRCRQSDIKRRPGRHGGKAFQWRIASDKRARTFLERNGWTAGLCNGQTEMFSEIAVDAKT